LDIIHFKLEDECVVTKIRGSKLSEIYRLPNYFRLTTSKRASRPTKIVLDLLKKQKKSRRSYIIFKAPKVLSSIFSETTILPFPLSTLYFIMILAIFSASFEGVKFIKR